MAKTKVTKTAESPQNITLLNHELSLHQLVRTKVDIGIWRSALQAAESVFSPIRYNLLQVYQEIMLDAHMAAISGKRIRNVTNKDLVFRGVNGEVDEKLNKQLDKRWLHKVVVSIMETIFWGHTLVEFKAEGYEVKDVKIIPRQHVRPEYGIVALTSGFSLEGIPFRDPEFAAYTYEVDLGLGLLNVACANVIYKRGGVIDYANFVELFGSPIREIRYDNTYPNAKAEADEIAEKSGNSAFIVLPKDSMELELHKGADGNSGDLHKSFAEMLKEELTILVLGQTMTTTSGSSYNQGAIHLKEQDQITEDDKKLVVSILNEQILPKLINLGYKLEGGEFEFNDTEELTLKDQLEIAKGVSEKVVIDDDYWYETFNIPKPKNPKPLPTGQEGGSPKKEKTPAEQKKKTTEIN